MINRYMSTGLLCETSIMGITNDMLDMTNSFTLLESGDGSDKSSFMQRLKTIIASIKARILNIITHGKNLIREKLFKDNSKVEEYMRAKDSAVVIQHVRGKVRSYQIVRDDVSEYGMHYIIKIVKLLKSKYRMDIFFNGNTSAIHGIMGTDWYQTLMYGDTNTFYSDLLNDVSGVDSSELLVASVKRGMVETHEIELTDAIIRQLQNFIENSKTNKEKCNQSYTKITTDIREYINAFKPGNWSFDSLGGLAGSMTFENITTPMTKFFSVLAKLASLATTIISLQLNTIESVTSQYIKIFHGE
jgi:hypothetical protein